MKETGGRRYPQRLTGHSGVRPGRIARNHPERTKQQHQQLLCVHGQGGDYPAEGDNAFISWWMQSERDNKQTRYCCS